MARDRSQDPDDIEALLAEVDQTLHGQPRAGRPPATRADQDQAASSRAGVGDRLARGGRTGLIAGLAAAVVVWVAFWLLPFLGAWSGGAGAFCAAFGVGFWFGLRRG